MRLSLIQAVLCWSIALVPDMASSIKASGPPKAYLSAQDIRRKMSESLRLIDSINVKYRGESLINNENGNYVFRHVIVARPLWMYHHGAHGSRRISWEDDVEQQKAWIGREKYFNEFPMRRVYFFDELSSTDPLPGTLQNEIWFQFTGQWQLDMRPPPLLWNLVPSLTIVCESEDYSHVRPAMEKVDGRWCHVLERKGVESLWFDCERGCSLMKREAVEPEGGKLFGSLELTRYTKAAPGIWLPRRIRNRQYAWTGNGKSLTNDFVLAVLEITVNDITSDRFEFYPRPGSISFHADRSRGAAQQSEPGGVDYLDEVIAWIERVYGRAEPEQVFDVRPSICVTVSIALLLITVLETRRKTRKATAIQNRCNLGSPKEPAT